MATFKAYYMKPSFFVIGITGNGGDQIDPKDLNKTHIFLKDVEATDLEDVFMKLQDPPNMSTLIREKGLAHSSMSIGDVIVDPTGQIHLVDTTGFAVL